MIEIYCDSSFNEDGNSFIGIVVVRDGVEVHQSTTIIRPQPGRNLECEISAIELAIATSKIFPADKTIIYNDSTEAVKPYQSKGLPGIMFEYVPREGAFQTTADRLSKKFPHVRVSSYGLCKKPVETFTPDILKDIALNKKPVLYVEKDAEASTNTRTCYRLVIRNIDGIIDDKMTFIARSGEVKNVKMATDVSIELEDMPGLNGSYFLLTDETWGLRLKGNEAYSIMPCSVTHRIICHEVDRSPSNLFRRACGYL
jgi:hypothetical protein